LLDSRWLKGRVRLLQKSQFRSSGISIKKAKEDSTRHQGVGEFRIGF
jgi:hypothetical protein